MSKDDNGKTPQPATLADLERRLGALEKELAFMREHGISQDERQTVLDRDQPRPERRRGGALVPLWLALLTVAVFWCAWALRSGGADWTPWHSGLTPSGNAFTLP